MAPASSAFLPFAVPDIGEEEISAAVAAMRSGWLTTGPRVSDFEHEFVAYLGGDIHCIALNSATAGLHLALEGLGIGPGDEVLVPTWTFTASAEVVRYVGADPVIVDVDPSTLELDLARAEDALTDRTRAVIPVHFAGLPMSAKDIDRFAGEHSLAVVEDAAHAFPAASEGVTVGAGTSDATVFSFYATKTMTTGEGGMLVTRNPELAQRARRMRLHGISRDVFDRYRSTVPAWRYDVVAPGFKYNLTDPAAAVGRVQLRRADTMRSARARIADRYLEALVDLPLDLPARGPATDLHSWHLFVIRLRDSAPVARDRFIELMADAGVGCSVHFIPLHLQSYWRDRYSLQEENFPVATAEFSRVVSLPIFSSMTDQQVDRVIATVHSVLDR